MTTTVTLLTLANCELCEHAKAVLGRVANDFPLEVRTVDLVSDDGTALASTIGLAFPPGVLLDGVAFSHGRLSERKLRRELTRRAAQPQGGSATPAQAGIVSGADPETPEPQLSRAERKAERQRLRAVRRERRRQSLARAKDNKRNKKDNKKEMKGKRR